MASAFLVVGVGGCGRGVCTHIKHDIEQEFGSLEAAKIKILVIDGPDKDDVYALPGGFEIDTGKDSPEFYRTMITPAPVIKNIAGGRISSNEAYIAQWLSQKAAEKIPTDSIDPTTGFGGHRSPGHAYFYLDVGNIKTRLVREYDIARKLLGGSEKSSNQVIIVVVGSQSGGTGAGLLFDVMHLLRDIALQNHDMVMSFLPLANTYHNLPSSPGQMANHNAQNFAGLLNLMRFMTTTNNFPTIIKYSDMVEVHNARIADIPFVIDGNVPNAKFNDVPPRLGVVPVIADFLLTIIKDNIRTSVLQPRITDWAQKNIGAAEYPEKYAALGATSIRYSHKDILQTFSYRFTVALYDLILNPIGTEFDKGKIIANSILNQITFTQMVENPQSTSLEPPSPPKFSPEFRTLGSRIRTGNPGEQPFPYPAKPFTEQIDYGHSVTRLGGLREKVDVKNDAIKLKENLKLRLETWIMNQHEKIVTRVVKDIEDQMNDVFYVKQGEHLVPRTLQDSPSSIIIARDLLKYLLEKLENYQGHLSSEFNNLMYPNGPEKNSIIAEHLLKLNDAETKMIKRSSSETQKKYLEVMQKHFNLEVWDILVQGSQSITSDIIKRVNSLWNLIGEGADGWITILRKYRDLINGMYQGDLERRRGFDKMRLRRYVPNTGSEAEDRLFEEVAVPVLNSLKPKVYWTFAIDSQIPGKYEILINSPSVPNYDNKKSINDLRDVITGKKLEDVHYYNPFSHCQYAINEIGGPLDNKTVWDILEIECNECWCKDQRIPPDRRNSDAFALYLAEDFLKRSDVALDYRNADNLLKQDYTICYLPGDIGSVGGKFIKELENKDCQISSHQGLSKEVRRVNLHFRIPIKQWGYYGQAQTDYVKYIDSKVPKILIDIYPQEQNANRIRKYIESRIDYSFTQVIETSVSSLLYDYNIFQKAALCYVMGLIPTVAGAEAISPKRYSLSLNAGSMDLGEEWDIYTLMNNINRPEREMTDKHWQSNIDVHDEITSIWNIFLQGRVQNLSGLAVDLKAQVKNIQLPSPPTGQTDSIDPQGKQHLTLAIRAVVEEYAELLQ